MKFTVENVYNHKPDEYRVPLCVVAHIPAKGGGNIFVIVLLLSYSVNLLSTFFIVSNYQSLINKNLFLPHPHKPPPPKKNKKNNNNLLQHKSSHGCVIYLFEVTKMSIHHPTNSFQKLIPLFGLNIRECSNLETQVHYILKA